jgi:Sulfotransferase family
MSMQEGRASTFARNTDLETRLRELSELLAPAEALALDTPPTRPWPLILVVGAPRSGTTLMLQWLAASGALAYPSNLLSRFHAAPAIGARIQQLLCDPAYAHGEELAGLQSEFDFSSNLGKTRGPLAPHEFWYLWRRFLPTVDLEPLGERAEQVDWAGLRSEFLAVAEVFGAPFACKGMMVQYDLALACEHLPEALILFVERDEDANAASLLRARERFFGDRTRWYSAKPPEYADLAALDPEDQVTGQVRFTNQHIKTALAGLPPRRSLHVSYESFCEDPATVWRALAERLSGYDLPLEHPGPASFTCTNP